MQSITPSVQDTTVAPPAFSLGTLRDVLAEFEPQYGQRAIRAANIVAIRPIEQSPASGLWWVPSETDPDQTYFVSHSAQFNVWVCTCQDFQRRGGPCKHAIAVLILRECEARERGPELPPIPLPFVELDPDAPIPFVLTDRALAATAAVA